ncbi:MAG TPA: DUF1571 domain-containing protein [Gemmataceae bacterium]|nr:DUF1571 domain-containing protein [Gemmataceae bacterium]
MRPLLLCLVPCYLLSAAPSAARSGARPPERPLPVISDDHKPLPDAVDMERLAGERPTEFLKECLLRYKRDVKGYRLTMSKEERIAGQLEPREVMEVAFREKPFSVFLKWDTGSRRAERALYVAGENQDRVLARPTKGWYWMAKAAGRLDHDGLAVEDVDGEAARRSGRFTIKEFGVYNGLARLLADWEAAQKKDALHVEYLGVQGVAWAANRPCWVLRRTRFLKPERDGVTEQTVYIDKETWLQVGSVAGGKDGLIGAYYYRDVEINPEFAPDQFRPAGLKK